MEFVYWTRLLLILFGPFIYFLRGYFCRITKQTDPAHNARMRSMILTIVAISNLAGSVERVCQSKTIAGKVPD